MARLPGPLTMTGRAAAAVAVAAGGCLFAVLALVRPSFPEPAAPVAVATVCAMALLVAVLYFLEVRDDADVVGGSLDLRPAPHGSGGIWGVDIEGDVLVPARPARVTACLVPSGNRDAGHAVGALVGTETVWERRPRRFGRIGLVPHETRFVETPFALDGPSTLSAGLRAQWSGTVAVPPGAPPSVDLPGRVSCSWSIEIAVGGTDASVVQGVCMVGGAPAPPGIGVSAERVEAGNVDVAISMAPVPLDLSDAARVSFVVGSGEPLPARRAIAYIATRFEPSPGWTPSWAGERDGEAPAPDAVAWRETRKIEGVPAGRTNFRFEVPPLRKLFADAALPHGRVRSSLRFVLEASGGRRVEAERPLPVRMAAPEAAEPAVATPPSV